MVLYKLMPYGVGTWEAESLASYIRRLAYWNGFTLPQLLRQIPDFDHDISPDVSRYSLCFLKPTPFLSRLLAQLNASGFYLHLWRHSFSVFLRFDPQLRLLLRDNPSICPRCLSEDIEAGRDPYFRLIWMFRSYDVCFQHSVKLVEKCWQCGRSFGVGSKAGLSNCPRCGTPFIDNDIEIVSFLPVNFDLITLMECLQNSHWQNLDSKSALESLDEIMEIACTVHQHIPAEWAGYIMDYKSRPTLYRARQLAFLFSCSIKTLLYGGIKQNSLLLPIDPFANSPEQLVTARIRGRTDRELLAEVMNIVKETALQPCSLAEIARRVDASPGGLQHRFPAVAEMISYLWKQRRAHETALLDSYAKLTWEIGKKCDTRSKKKLVAILQSWGFGKNISRAAIQRAISQSAADDAVGFNDDGCFDNVE